jgi:hypothetical protein
MRCDTERSFLESSPLEMSRVHVPLLSSASDVTLKRAPARRSWTKDHLV